MRAVPQGLSVLPTFLVYGFLSLFMTLNALRSPSPPGSKFPPLWLPAVLAAEAPLFWLIIRIVVASAAWLAGAGANPVGRAALLLVGASLALQPILIGRASRSARDLSPDLARATRWEALTSWPYRTPPEVERLGRLAYGEGLTFDLYRRKDHTGHAPVVVYLHGGSWGGGDPRRQFRPIVHHLARRGWIVLTIRYPLSPAATFPDHLNGALVVFDWIETNCREFGIDPERVTIAGGSAGAHLAALAALGGDKRIKAAVGLYGVYDFLNRNRHRADWPVIPRKVMKATSVADKERYRLASPVDQTRPDAPPFLLVHGDYDSLVPLAETKFFASQLSEAGASVEMVEVRWGQHAFDVLNGLRSRALAVVVEGFLAGRGLGPQ